MQASAKSDKQSSDFAIPEAGNQPAVCIRIIDLGTQKNVKYNNENRKVKFVFELVDTEHVFNEENGPQPFVVSKEYTVSLNEKANLRKDVESWMNRKLTDSELDLFNIDVLLGKPAFVTVTHKSSADGKKTYANVGMITSPMKGFVVNKPKNDMFVFDIGAPGWKEKLELLWKNDKEKIMASPEYTEAEADKF